MRRIARGLVAFGLLSSTATVDAESSWVLWAHSYEVWVDKNKDNPRRDVVWKKVAVTMAKADCSDRAVSEARAEYYTLVGKGVRATVSGSEVGFDQRNTRFTHGYRKFECWPGSVDPRGPKGKP